MAEILKTLKVNSTPPRRIRKIIGDTSLTLPDAVAEIVANSFDARENEDERVSVEVYLGREQVLIVDNACGMTNGVLEQAIRLGVDMGRTLGRDADRMGYFGLGMKTACASIGDWWSIVTRPRGAGEEYTVEFDLLSDEADLDASPWEDEIVVRKPDPEGPLGSRPHGTAIIVRKLHRRGPYEPMVLGSVVQRLSEAFKGFLQQGDVICVKLDEGDQVVRCSPPTYRLIQGSRMEFIIPLLEDDPSKVVSGWLGLATTVDTKGDRGFNIYRKGQLIQAWNKDWYDYHPTTSYLLGDVNLDFIRANFFKKGLQEQSLEWDLVRRTMKEFLKPAVAAARKIRRSRTRTELLEIVNTMRAEMGYPLLSHPQVSHGGDNASGPHGLNGSEDSIDSGGDGGTGDRSLPPQSPPIRVSLSVLTLDDGQKIVLDYAEEALDTQMTPWDYMAPPGKDQLLAVANTHSEIYKQVNDHRLLLALTVSDAILQFLIEQKGKSPHEARTVRNEWLHGFLVSREVRI